MSNEKEIDENEQIAQRREKLAQLRENSIAFPVDFRRNVVAGELHAEYDDMDSAELDTRNVRCKVAGRMMSRRIMGKNSFAHIQDMSGKIQLFVQRDEMPEGFYNAQFKKWDIGDIVGVEGVLFKTNAGELTVRVEKIRLLTKSLRPLRSEEHTSELQSH